MADRSCVRCGTPITERIGLCPTCGAPVVATAGDSERVNEALAVAAREAWLAESASRSEATDRDAVGAERNVLWKARSDQQRRARRNAVLVLLAGVVLLVLAPLARGAEDDATYEVDLRDESGQLSTIRCEAGLAVVGGEAADAACAAEEPREAGNVVAPVLVVGGVVLLVGGGFLLTQSGRTAQRRGR